MHEGRERPPMPAPIELPEELFEKTLSGDFNDDSSEYGADLAQRAEAFLASSKDEKEWEARIDKIREDVGASVGSYNHDVISNVMDAFLRELLRRKFFPKDRS